jgi:hypothetical protein
LAGRHAFDGDGDWLGCRDVAGVGGAVDSAGGDDGGNDSDSEGDWLSGSELVGAAGPAALRAGFATHAASPTPQAITVMPSATRRITPR